MNWELDKGTYEAFIKDFGSYFIYENDEGWYWYFVDKNYISTQKTKGGSLEACRKQCEKHYFNR